MASLVNRTIIVLLVTQLLCWTCAFQSPVRRDTSLHPPAAWQVEKPTLRTTVSFRTSTLSLQDQRNGNDSKEKGGYKGVEDGSPLGVAIVVLGGSLVAFGGDDFANIPVWAILAAASTAAGAARLIRYLQDK